MKQLFIVLAFLISIDSGAQDSRTKVVPVLAPQSFYLNGGVRASLGGRSRLSHKIELPANTIEWYYEFTTTANKEDEVSMDLVGQLATLTIDPSGITAAAINGLVAPTGSGSVDIYLLEAQNLNPFIQKADQNGGTFYYYPSGTRENHTQGVVQVKDLTVGELYLGFRNPSETTGVNVTVEVVAIVYELSAKERQAEIYADLGWKAYEKGDLLRCIELSKKALELDKKQLVAQANLAFCMAILNQDEYLDEYVKAIDMINQSANRAWYFQAVLQDISNYENQNGVNTNFELVKELIEQELKR